MKTKQHDKKKSILAPIEMCLWIDKEHPGERFAKRYYVSEIESAVKDGQTVPDMLCTQPDIGFWFTSNDISWIRANKSKVRITV